MKIKANRKCYFCGKPYFACDSSLQLGSWKASCCCPEHYQAWMIVLAVQEKSMTPSEALEALKRINIKPSTASDAVGAKSILDAAFAKPAEPAVETGEATGEVVEALSAKRPYTRKPKPESEDEE